MAVRSAKQVAALKKAQLASARARKGRGKAKPVARRRIKRATPVAKKRVRRTAQPARATVRKRKVANPTASKSNAVAKNSRRKVAKRVAIGASVALAAGGAAYTYKNRERLIVTPMAERRFVGIEQRKLGRKLTKGEKNAVIKRERALHGSRSTGAVRAYKEARGIALANRGKSLNPLSKNYFASSNSKLHTAMIDDGRRGGGVTAGRFLFELYRKDVNVRAEHRLNRMKGKKASFGYRSGKQKKVLASGRVVRQHW